MLLPLTSHSSALFPYPHDAQGVIFKNGSLVSTSSREGGIHHRLSNLSPHFFLSYKVTDVFLQHEGVGFLTGMQLATAETQKEEGAMQGNYTRTKKMLITQ